MPGSKHWVFTLNNYSEEDVQNLRGLCERGTLSYLVFGRETANTGTKHLQGYAVFERRMQLRAARRLIGEAHLEKKQGTPKQASDYCKKDGDFEEYGTLPAGQGSRTDLREAIDKAKQGTSLRELIEEHGDAYVKFNRGLDKIRLLYGQARTWETCNIVYWGDTGLGKTRRAMEECEEEAYIHPGGAWFDGYDGQRNVIMDDFGGSEFKITYLLKLLDRYPMRVPVKGGYVQWLPKRIFITSNYHPIEWYPNAKDRHKEALIRRLQVIEEVRMSADGPEWFKE
jgi:hypothetical protein